jgi:hypothetical protein
MAVAPLAAVLAAATAAIAAGGPRGMADRRTPDPARAAPWCARRGTACRRPCGRCFSPVFVEYQPRWWFEAQGVLDDSEPFP